MNHCDNIQYINDSVFGALKTHAVQITRIGSLTLDILWFIFFTTCNKKYILESLFCSILSMKYQEIIHLSFAAYTETVPPSQLYRHRIFCRNNE
jgi:hypothetical protein